MPDFSYGDPSTIEAAVNQMIGIFADHMDQQSRALMRSQIDQIVTHFRVSGWNDVMIGASLYFSLSYLSDLSPSIVLAVIADAVGVTRKEIP